MDDFSADSAVKGYLPLMHELAIRMDIVARACDGKLNLSPPYAREFAYFQFRRMCEIIALGCLLLHGDLPFVQTIKTKNEWNAEKIMKALHKNYIHAFPQSLTREKTSDGWKMICNSKPNALSIGELKNLYNECGHVLHRGSIRSLEAEKAISRKDYDKVLEWQSKLVDLMNEHFIGRANGKGFYIISLRTESGYPECCICTPNKSGGLDVATRNMNVLYVSDI